ncbi:MAG: hypothetical protein IJK50_08285 [Prevotella sp.]|jgi:hypothetical protein|nr:hypothetical protein [Prevotella sp.]
MPNEFPTPAFPSSDDATAAIALPKVLDYFKEFYCSKVKIDILRYGLEEALRRWKQDIERMHTEDWWPPVARAVEAVINEAFEARARKEEIARQQEVNQQVPMIGVAVNQTVTQAQSNREEKIDKRSVNMSGDHATYEENNQPNE